jgi:hypothetical protein
MERTGTSRSCPSDQLVIARPEGNVLRVFDIVLPTRYRTG